MYLLRHGQSEFNVIYGKTRKDPGIRDPKLTPLGKNQALHAAKSLEQLGLKKILSSPYRRALETATIVARHLDLNITATPLLGEHAVFNCDIGSPKSTLCVDFPHVAFLDPVTENWWPDLEEDTLSLNRRCKGFRRFASNYDVNTVVVSHWGFIRCLTNIRAKNCGILHFSTTSQHPGGGTVVSNCDPC